MSTSVNIHSLEKDELVAFCCKLQEKFDSARNDMERQIELMGLLEKHSQRSKKLAEMARIIDVRSLDAIEEAATESVADIFNAQKVGLFLTDRDKILLALKKSYPRQFHFPPLDMVNDSDVLLMHLLHSGPEPKIFQSISSCEISEGSEFRPHPTDSFFQNGCMVIPLLYDAPQNAAREVVGVLALAGGKFTSDDIAEARVAAEILATNLSNHFLLDKLSHLAETDGLTELYNHRHFQQELTRASATHARYKTHFSLIMVDIDHFKAVNDTYLHQTGDVVLKEVSRLIRQSLRDNVDIASRYGGEEFSIILPQTNIEGALVVAERLRKSVEDCQFRIGGEIIRITVSIGVAQYQKGMEKGKLIELADSALYKAKQSGRNKVICAQ